MKMIGIRDVDDTAAVITAMAKIHQAETPDFDEVLQRGFHWVLAMQGSDGGWGAYDKDNNKLIFNRIPFADHQALLDPSTADLAGRCLEMLGTLGYDQSHQAVGPALEFLRAEQEPNGSWYGRWGVNYIYGTWCVLSGLRAIGVDMTAPWVQKAVIWLESVQNSDGGWGESCESYADIETSGQGESAASQTAWAIMALLQAGESDSLSVARGVNWLIRHQREDGVWDEPFHTGTGFPRVFYLRYHGYFKYFPIWALGMYRNVKMTGEAKADQLRKKAQASPTTTEIGISRTTHATVVPREMTAGADSDQNRDSDGNQNRVSCRCSCPSIDFPSFTVRLSSPSQSGPWAICSPSSVRYRSGPCSKEYATTFCNGVMGCRHLHWFCRRSRERRYRVGTCWA